MVVMEQMECKSKPEKSLLFLEKIFSIIVHGADQSGLGCHTWEQNQRMNRVELWDFVHFVY